MGHVTLTPQVHNELNDWCSLLIHVVSHPTHLYELMPPAATAFGFHDASGLGLGGFFFLESGESFFREEPLTLFASTSLILVDNPDGSLTINDLEFVVHVVQLHLAAAFLTLLTHFSNGANNMTAIL
eukprot:14143275-Ditylum_brightwellii.AAC.1